MISHLELVACKAPHSCPPLEGNTFNIQLDESVQGIDGATVKIESDLSYTITTPGQPDQSGQLTLDKPGRYKYSEPGPPPITGRLNCVAGTWYFSDRTSGGGGESGVLEPAGGQ